MATTTERDELEKFQDVLRRLEASFVSQLHVPSVLPELFSNGVVTSAEKQEIQSKGTPHESVSCLMTCIRRLHRGKETVKLLYDILMKRDHSSLANQLEEGTSV